MSKGFKGKTCTYCGVPDISQTGDHVFAREFFPKDGRANLPKVPACELCNREKSELEHYLTAVLPFASHHPVASKLLETRVPERLARNRKLHRELAVGRSHILMQGDGTLTQRMTIPFEGPKLAALFRMIVRGLAAHHWGVFIPQDYHVGAGILTETGDAFMRALFLKNSKQQVAANLSDGLVLYEGVQAFGNPALTIWRFQLYGGTQFGGDPDIPHEMASDIWGLSAHVAIPGLFDAD